MSASRIMCWAFFISLLFFAAAAFLIAGWVGLLVALGIESWMIAWAAKEACKEKEEMES